MSETADYELKAALQARDRWVARALAAEKWGATVLGRAESAEERIVAALVSLDYLDAALDDTHPEGDGCHICNAAEDLRAALAHPDSTGARDDAAK